MEGVCLEDLNFVEHLWTFLVQHWLFGGWLSIRRETCLLLLTHNQAMPSKDQATPQPQPIQPGTQPIQPKTQPIQPETQPIQPETQPIQTETQPKLLFPSNHTTIHPKAAPQPSFHFPSFVVLEIVSVGSVQGSHNLWRLHKITLIGTNPSHFHYYFSNLKLIGRSH